MEKDKQVRVENEYLWHRICCTLSLPFQIYKTLCPEYNNEVFMQKRDRRNFPPVSNTYCQPLSSQQSQSFGPHKSGSLPYISPALGRTQCSFLSQRTCKGSHLLYCAPRLYMDYFPVVVLQIELSTNNISHQPLVVLLIPERTLTISLEA